MRQKKITELEKSESVFGFSDDTSTHMPRYKPSRDIRPIPLQEERLVQSLEQLALAAGMAAPGVSVAEWISNLQQKLQAEVFQQGPPGGSGGAADGGAAAASVDVVEDVNDEDDLAQRDPSSKAGPLI